ncbi:50S ribosomal protein L33 [Mycoplasmopsis gallinacea]|uniref:Large ribosomal subunit protein bL33 n=1 Tax=Mycoplasmopsis gallinacea TaxID=29556 RepID=A0A0D5ZJG2_9BACT|nr:50S ribosomal protein L33 [Mycoplasmopsis gallinacea]AKA49877.1 50S ribosomal protein L33 [Mycoplasmopsis gallinacea]QIW62242.1 50S ribosomal protein L33 [Mycoplasmopsis gallinacea]
MKKNNTISLACFECKRKNYSTNKSAGTVKRIEKMKYCKNCEKSTLHKEEV